MLLRSLERICRAFLWILEVGVELSFGLEVGGHGSVSGCESVGSISVPDSGSAGSGSSGFGSALVAA